MTYALLILLSLHVILADTRTLSEGEALAFEAVFGTSNMQKLQEIEGAIGCFYQFHELPSIRNAKEIQDKESLLFMKPPDVLSDFGFCQVVPYFTNRDADFNWHTQEIKPDPSTNVLCEPVTSFFLLTFFLLNQVKLLLECWRTASCYDASTRAFA